MKDIRAQAQEPVKEGQKAALNCLDKETLIRLVSDEILLSEA